VTPRFEPRGRAAVGSRDDPGRPAGPGSPASGGLPVVIALVIVIAAAAAGCSGGPSASPGPIETDSISVPATASPDVTGLESPVTGVLTHIDSTGLSSVTGFTLRLDDGRQVMFRIGVLENGDQFPPGHLAEHLATSAPVRVFFHAEGADLVVYRLEDGG
jgi:hypothetical protein